MRIGNIVSALVNLYNNEATRKRAVMLVGKSGIGKSDTVRQAQERLGISMYDMRLSTADPTDFGLMMPENGALVRQKPDFIVHMEEHPEGGFLFLDEITSAPPAVQAPAYQLVLDRQCNGFDVPKSWMVIAAGNRQSDRGVTYPIAAPLLNRMKLVEVDTVLDDFLLHAAEKEISPVIMAFIKSRADFLHNFDSKAAPGTQFPTPRGWFAVNGTLQLDVPNDMRVELIRGDVGHEAGVAFEQFMRIWERMPDLDKIIRDPESVEVPKELDIRYCLVMGLSARMNKDNFESIHKFLKKLSKEFQNLAITLAYHRSWDIVQSPAFSEWAVANSDSFDRT